MSYRDYSRFSSYFIKNPATTCWEWSGHKTKPLNGYGVFSVKSRYYLAHRLSYLFFKGEFSKYLLVLHKCDNKKCVNPKHLFLGTHKDNATDRESKGRGIKGRKCGPKGERQGLAKLSDHKVISIRKLWSKGFLSQAKIAKKFNVTAGLIHCIVRNKNWTHIELAKNLNIDHSIKLSDNDLPVIKSLLKKNKTQMQIAKTFNVHQSTLSKFLKRKGHLLNVKAN